MRRQVCYTPRRRNENGANDARRRPTYPHPSFCPTGRNGRESRRGERQRHIPGRRQGKSACQGEGRAEEREESDEDTNETRGSQQSSKGRAQGGGHGRHTAHGGHHTAPKHQRGEHQTPHTPTPVPTARGQRAPAARPEGGQPGEGERLTPDAPHNGGRHPPRGHPTATPTASNAGPQGRAPWGRCWVPRPHGPHLGQTGHGTLAACTRGRAAGGGTAPDTRRPSQRWQATPPGDGPPPPPRQAAPTGHAGQEDSVGPPHPHTRAHSTWVADPNSRPSGPAVGGGGAPDLRRPSQRWKAAPRGRPSATPTASNAGPQGRTLWGQCWVPTPTPTTSGTHGSQNTAARPRGRAAGGGTAPDTRRPSQRWQANPPGNAPPPPPRHAAPTGHAGQGDSVGPPHPHTRPCSTWVADPISPPSGWAVWGGGAPDFRCPSQRWKAPPPGMPFHHPHSEQCRPARAHAVEPVLGPHARTDRNRNTRVAETQPPAPDDGQPREGQRLTPDAPHNSGRPPPPETAPRHPRGTQPPQGMQAKGTALGPHTHAPAPTARG